MTLLVFVMSVVFGWLVSDWQTALGVFVGFALGLEIHAKEQRRARRIREQAESDTACPRCRNSAEYAVFRRCSACGRYAL